MKSYNSRLVFYPIILVAFWMTETLVQVGYCFCMIAFYESVLMYYHKKNYIEIGEGKIVFVKKGNRTELEIKDIQNITLIDKKGELFLRWLMEEI